MTSNREVGGGCQWEKSREALYRSGSVLSSYAATLEINLALSSKVKRRRTISPACHHRPFTQDKWKYFYKDLDLNVDCFS